MNTNKKKAAIRRLLSLLIGMAAVLFWLLLWQLAAMAVDLPILLPSPIGVAKRLASLALTGVFWSAVGTSLWHVALGFACGLVCGVLTAVVSHLLKGVTALLSPLMLVIKATPVASFILLAYVWMSTDAIPVFTAFLMVLPIVYSAVFEGLSTLDRQLGEMLTLNRVPFARRLRLFYLPSLLPFLQAGAVTALGMSWKAGIAAEVLVVSRGSVGKYIYESKTYLETADLFAWTVTVILLSLVIELLFKRILGQRRKKA